MPDKQEEKDIFKALVSLDVNEHVEQKTTGKATLSYLSWPWAWSEIRKRYPDVSMKFLRTTKVFHTLWTLRLALWFILPLPSTAKRG